MSRLLEAGSGGLQADNSVLGRLKLNVCFASTDSGNWTRARENTTQPGEIYIKK